MTAGLWVLVALLLICVIGFWLYRNHQSWLEHQTPVGSWIATAQNGKITIVFEGGPHEGLYKRLMEIEGKPIREFGHWAQHKSKLQLLMMASDIPSNKAIGVDRKFKVLFFNSGKIGIYGPDRRGFHYVRAPEGTSLDFDQPTVPAVQGKPMGTGFENRLRGKSAFGWCCGD